MQHEFISEGSGKGAALQGKDALLTTYIEARGAQLMSMDNTDMWLTVWEVRVWLFEKHQELHSGHRTWCTKSQKQLLGWHLWRGSMEEDISDCGQRWTVRIGRVPFRHSHEVGPDLVNKLTGCPVKSEFQINEYFFGTCMSHAIRNTNMWLCKSCSNKKSHFWAFQGCLSH